jgi:hypothetical protein
MKSTNSQYKTTFTYTSDSPMTEGSGQEPTPPNSQSTIKRKLTPSYYLGKYKQIEAFDVCMDFQRDNYNLGVAIAYLLRAGKKEGNPIEQDIQKAIDHLEKELEYIAYEQYLETSAEIAKNYKSK